jgi:hypothetical protein
MKVLHERKNPRLPLTDETGWRANQAAAMHPDDYRAQLAWVRAKRMQNR